MNRNHTFSKPTCRLGISVTIMSITICLMVVTISAQPAPRPSDLHTGLSILLIGDSNTQGGAVTGGLAKALESAYGYFGAGYHSLQAEVGNGSSDSYLPYLHISNVGTWTDNYINDNDALSLLAPDGVCISSSTVGSHTDVTFYGTSIDVYWIGDVNNGKFTIAIDNGNAQTVDTKTSSQMVNRTRITGLSAANHTMVITVYSGTVALLGVDTRVGQNSQIAVVHKWGRSSTETRHYVSLNENRWKESLQLLNPDWVCIMLGTNDNEINFVGWATYTANLAIMVKRIQSALPNSRIMILSTIPHMESSNGMLYHSYWQKLPLLCSSMGVNYWNLNAYCGGTGPAVLAKGWTYGPSNSIHFCPLGGDSVGAELHRQILAAPAVTPQNLTGTISGSYPSSRPSFRGGQVEVWVAADGKMELDNQGRVISWYDVDNSIALSQIIATFRPILINNVINGKPAVHFNGSASSNCLVFPRTISMRAFSMVIRADSIGGALFNEGRCYYQNFGPGPKGSNNIINTSVANMPGTYYVNKAATPVGSLQYPQGSFKLITYDPQGYYNIRVLGENQYIQMYTAIPDSVDGFWKGDIAELIVFVNSFTDQTRQDVETYLWNKYNLGGTATALSSAHTGPSSLSKTPIGYFPVRQIECFNLQGKKIAPMVLKTMLNYGNDRTVYDLHQGRIFIFQDMSGDR